MKTGSLLDSDKEKFNIQVFDNNFKLLWKKAAELSYTDNRVNMQQFYVSDDGTVHLACKVWKTADEREKGALNYEYKIISVSESGMKEFPLDIGSQNLVSDAGIFFGTGDEMYAGGFFTERGTAKSTHDGVFMTSINRKTGATIASKAHKFPPEFLEGLIKASAIKKNKGLSRFDIYEIFYNAANESFQFVAEENYVTQHTYRNTDGSYTTYYIYHTNEIIIPSFSKDAKLNWIAKVDKRYSNRASSFTSYAAGAGDKGIYLVFNDFKTREEREESGKNEGKRAIYTDLAIVGPDGSIKTETIFTNKDEDLDTYFLPTHSDFIGRNTFLLYGQKKRDFQFGTLNLN
jgi:hypothetical protein